jgi:SAM-dependent methyltransferase
MASKQHPASFRDPAGFVFEHGEKFYRQVNQCYAIHYDLLKNSGLYEQLIRENKLLPHTEINTGYTENTNRYKTLLPEQLAFISYPYEWCFSQWKDAALLTLNIAKISIHHGMILKDATPFNIQFFKGSPVFIDTLSFEKYDDTKPWIAYRQFVECFIAPLLLARYQSPELLNLFRLYPDGIPLKLLVKLLPLKSKFNLNVLLHIILPASISINKKAVMKTPAAFTKQKLLRIMDNLVSFVQSVKLPAAATQWNNYYEETVLSSEYLAEKERILKEWIGQLPVKSVLDLGTNTGLFAQMTARAGKFTVAIDADIDCIDRLYNDCKRNKITNLIPLCVDITNPTPATGWDNQERSAFFPRSKADLCMALALMHHLAISKNIGFTQMARTLSSIAPWLIIEFIPKTDPKINLLLQNRPDIFEHYDELSFTGAFEKLYTLEKKEVLTNSNRILFLMKRKEAEAEI